MSMGKIPGFECPSCKTTYMTKEHQKNVMTYNNCPNCNDAKLSTFNEVTIDVIVADPPEIKQPENDQVLYSDRTLRDEIVLQLITRDETSNGTSEYTRADQILKGR